MHTILQNLRNTTAAALAIAVLGALGSAPPAHAHGDAQHQPAPFDPSKVEPMPFGQQGNPANVTRTVRVEMRDTMRFAPANITVRRGETVRFVPANQGQVLHEMVLGPPEALRAHAEMMKKHPGMEHDEPYMAHVQPGQSGEIVWHFTRPGEFQFACLLPGHFEAGMVGKVLVK